MIDLLADYLVAELDARLKATLAGDWAAVKVSRAKCENLEAAVAALTLLG